MALQIIYGKAGSGKTEYILNIAKETWKNSDKKVYVIIPEQYSYETEKALAENLGVISPKTVEVLSFKRLFYYVCNNLGGMNLPMLTDVGKHILLCKAANRMGEKLRTLKKTAKYRGFSKVIGGLFSEFKRYNISPEKLSGVVEELPENSFFKLKMQDISMLYKAYEEEIAGLFTDPDDELTILAKLLWENRDFFENSIILIDEFNGFTPQETEVICQLAKQAEQVKITLCTDMLTGDTGENSIFNMQIRTGENLSREAFEQEIPALPPVFLEGDFKRVNSPELSLLEKNLRENSYDVYEGKTDKIVISQAMNYTAELEQAAEEIIRLCRDKGYRYKDFMVVSRDMENYKRIAGAVFARYGLPVYMSEKTSAAEETPAYALMCALDIINKKWNYESVFSYLKTGFSSISDEETDLLENYIIRTGIRGSNWKSDKPWKYSPKGFDEQTLDKIEDIRKRFILPLVELERKFKEASLCREYIKAVVEFMQAENFFQKINTTIEDFKEISPDCVARYEQIYPAIIAALDEIDGVTGEDEQFSAEEFAEMLGAALEAHSVGIIPTSADSIAVTDAERCQAKKCKIMFLVGVCDGVFPGIFKGEGVIKDEERQQLENLGLKMAPDTMRRTFDEDFVVYSTLMAPSEKIYISYPMSSNKGESLPPSGFIKRIKEMFPQIKEKSDIEGINGQEAVVSPGVTLDRLAMEKSRQRSGEEIHAVWHDVENWYKANDEYRGKYQMMCRGYNYRNSVSDISKETLKGIFGKEVYTSVSRLESYKKCPFQHYVKYLIGATPRETSEIKRVDEGTMMHFVIENLSRRVEEELGSWQKAEDKWIEENVQALVSELTQQLAEELDTIEPGQAWSVVRMQEAMINSAKMVAMQLKSGEFVPMGYEIEFSDSGKYKCIEFDIGDTKVKLRGKIDRGDIFTDPTGRKFIRIVDYKSGARDFNISSLYMGVNLQMAVYLDSLTTQENAKCAGMLYFRLHNPVKKTEGDIKKEGAQALFEKEYRNTGLILADEAVIEKMDSQIKSKGESFLPVKFNKDGSISATSNVATYEQFAALNKYLRKTIREMAAEMLRGRADISPVKTTVSDACDYCEYKAICHFDESNGNKKNVQENITTKDAWERIMQEGGEENA